MVKRGRRTKVDNAAIDARARRILDAQLPRQGGPPLHLIVRCQRCRGQAAAEREDGVWVYNCMHCAESWNC